MYKLTPRLMRLWVGSVLPRTVWQLVSIEEHLVDYFDEEFVVARKQTDSHGENMNTSLALPGVRALPAR